MIFLWSFIGAVVSTIVGSTFTFFLTKRFEESKRLKESKKSVLNELILNKSAIECCNAKNDSYKKFSSALNNIPLIYSKDSDVLSKYDIFKKELREYRRRRCRSEDGSFELILYESFYNLVYSICDNLKIERYSIEHI